MVVQDANVYLRGDQIDRLDVVVDDDERPYDSRSDAVRDAVDDLLEVLEDDDTGEA